MFGIAWSELLIIGIVALVVVPPKDLPTVLRAVGKWVTQMRRMATDFQVQVNSALKEAEFDEVKKSVADLTRIDGLDDLKRDLEAATQPMTFLEGQMRHDVAELESDLHRDLTGTPSPAIAALPETHADAGRAGTDAEEGAVPVHPVQSAPLDPVEPRPVAAEADIHRPPVTEPAGAHTA